MPRRQRPVTPVERAVYRRFPALQRAMRSAIYWARELFAIPMIRVALAPMLRRVGTAHLARAVGDPELRAKLTPDYLPGCKRILVSNDYLPSLSKPNVELVCEGISEVRGRTIVADDGRERDVDTIILGTGFKVLDMPIADRVRDGAGRSLAEHWDGSPRAHRGTMVAGFPNLFFLLGPNTGLGHNSVVYMAEAQAGYIMRALRHMRVNDLATLEVGGEAERRWNEEVQSKMDGTVWLEGGCSSWYLDRNGLNTSLWPDFSFRFARALRRFDPAEHVATGPPVGPAVVPVAG
jgi:cation diffusion facilitator CzcD-associated flavoprotein CzcO